MSDKFGTQFTRSFLTGLPIGVQSFQAGQKRRADTDEKLRELQEKQRQKNKEVSSYAELLGVDIKTDPSTGEVTTDIPEGFEFSQPSEDLMARLFPEIGTEFQQTFGKLKKESEPNLVGYKRSFDPESGAGQVTAIDTKTGGVVRVGDDPTYQPKKLHSDIIEGVTTFDGEDIGTKGRRTRLMIMEDGTYQTIDLGKIRKGSAGTTQKPLDLIAFELDLADLTEKVDNTVTKRNTYLTKKCADPEARDAFRDGINSEFNEQAWEYAKLGSRTAQAEILEIFKQGKITIGDPKVTRKMYYEQKKHEVEQEYIGGVWGYKDSMAILQFLDKKYNQWLPYEESKREDDELKFELPELKLD